MLSTCIKLSEFRPTKTSIKRTIQGQESELSEFYTKTSPAYPPNHKPLLVGSFEVSRLTDDYFCVSGFYSYEPYTNCSYCNRLISFEIRERIEYIASPTPSSEDTNGYLIKNNEIDLMKIIEESVFLAQPLRLSCSPPKYKPCHPNNEKRTEGICSSMSQAPAPTIGEVFKVIKKKKKTNHKRSSH